MFKYFYTLKKYAFHLRSFCEIRSVFLFLVTCIGLAQGPLFYVSKTELRRRLAFGVDVGVPVRGVPRQTHGNPMNGCEWYMGSNGMMASHFS